MGLTRSTVRRERFRGERSLQGGGEMMEEVDDEDEDEEKRSFYT